MILSKEAEYVEPFPPVAELVRGILEVRPEALKISYPGELELANAPLWTDDYSDLLSVLKIPNWKNWKSLWESSEPAAGNGHP